MKTAIGLSVLVLWFVLCGSLTMTAQILPTSSGGCSLSASSVMSCNFLDSMPKGNTQIKKQIMSGGRSELVTIRINVSPGALLTRLIPGEEELMVGLGKGELINEAKSPHLDISMSDGLVLLMPKDEPYALRNAGKQDIDILVIRMHPTSPASQ